MSRAWRWVIAAAVLIPALAIAALAHTARRDLALPTDEALAALASSDNVRIQFDAWLVMRPASSEPSTGFILYPGANCDVRGYAPVLRELAAAGYLVVTVPMPFNRAVLAPNRATAVRAAFPEIRRWIIAGHSLGGAMAARYAFKHQEELAGLIVWDSHPPEANSLADSRLPVVHIHRATLEGAPPSKFHEKRHLFPASSRWVPIPGGIHMYFGSFRGGGYEEEWSPRITRDEQHRLEIRATLDAMARMSQ